MPRTTEQFSLGVEKTRRLLTTTIQHVRIVLGFNHLLETATLYECDECLGSCQDEQLGALQKAVACSVQGARADIPSKQNDNKPLAGNWCIS